jgi:hypothetical protein
MLRALRDALRLRRTAVEPGPAPSPSILVTNAPEPPYAGGDGFAYYFEPALNLIPAPRDGFPVVAVGSTILGWRL